MISDSVYLVSLGCPKNLVDTERLMGEFIRLGYKIVHEPHGAEVILINTCAFIQPAVQESIDTILELAEYKKQGRCRLLMVAGCLPQRYAGDLQKGLPEVDVFFGPGEASRLEEFLREGKRDIRHIAPYMLPLTTKDPVFLPRQPATPFYTSYLKIADGCDNKCTFCTIPAIRGPYRSSPLHMLVREAEELAARGVVELNLVAQDTTRYGEDLTEGVDLAELLLHLARIPDLRWIRVLYLYPERVSDKLIQTMASTEKILPYLDVPLQHVSPRICRKMGRKRADFEALKFIRRVRDLMPEGAIRSTLMVGFPGETLEDFNMLLDFVRTARIDHLGVFPFYPEEGTPANRMGGRVSKKEKEARVRRIMALQAEISRELNQAKVGTVQEILVEGLSSETDFLLQGRMRTQAPDIDGVVYINKGRARAGEIVRVLITQAAEYDLVGEIVG
jgi:ribosomal protein S12 methylthiotransferase